MSEKTIGDLADEMMRIVANAEIPVSVKVTCSLDSNPAWSVVLKINDTLELRTYRDSLPELIDAVATYISDFPTDDSHLEASK